MKKIWLISLILISMSIYSEVEKKELLNCSCADEIKLNLESIRQNTLVQYRTKNSFVKLDNDSEFLEGTSKNDVIILIHGFIASPFEVRSIAYELNRAGYSVYMPLLEGFGAYGSMANNGKLINWRNQIKATVNELSRCYSNITLGGISLGAALATDYALSTEGKNISGLVLYSPYFEISQSVAEFLIGPLSAIKSSLDITTLYSIYKSSDLVEIVKNKDYYSDIMPFITLQEVFKLGKEIQNIKLQNKSNIPVFVAYSQYDETINLELAHSIPFKYFNTVTEYVIDKKYKVPHQITYESSNSKFSQLLFKTQMFLWTDSN
jgi:esterase/lipase